MSSRMCAIVLYQDGREPFFVRESRQNEAIYKDGLELVVKETNGDIKRFPIFNADDVVGNLVIGSNLDTFLPKKITALVIVDHDDESDFDSNLIKDIPEWVFENPFVREFIIDDEKFIEVEIPDEYVCIYIPK